MSPSQLARHLDVTEKRVYDWIRGPAKPGDDNARKIADALGITEAVVRAQLGLYVSPELIELARREWRNQGLEAAAKRKRDREVLDELADIGRAFEETQAPPRNE